ncbi:MAG: tRNA (cytidine(34)-2'-O)-methyltransferase [Actinomycetia bacterium]|nr:tRNA (cytidine(34)-2'-O)-methyltransferase [Actinomycetes bacterium]
MFDVILHEPAIPPNTGNIMRLCANTGARLHLVEPLGFDLSDRQLRRAGLDYRDLATVTVHASWKAVRTAVPAARWLAFTAKGCRSYADVAYQPNDALVFGTEPTGLPDELLATFPQEHQLRLPMIAGSRSINLSNAVAVAVYEGWRQLDYVDSVLR